MKLDKRIEEAVPAGQQLQELGMRLRCLDDGSSDQVILFRPHDLRFENKLNLIESSSSILQDDLLDDDDDDRLIMDRSPDETASQDLDELDSDDEFEGTMASDGERIIYPWMKKVHVAGVGKWNIFDAILQSFLSYSLPRAVFYSDLHPLHSSY